MGELLILESLQARSILGAFKVPFLDDVRSIEVSQMLRFQLHQDYQQGCIVLSGSLQSGLNDLHHALNINPLLGLQPFQLHGIAGALDIARQHWPPFVAFGLNLYHCFTAIDATLLTVDVLITEQNIVAASTVEMMLDDNALFRHPEIKKIEDNSPENVAQRHGFSYVRLEGQIGCMTNGAGLAMAMLDQIAFHGQLHGISAANFLDIGGGAKADRIPHAMRLLFEDDQVRCILINIFGGITRCDEIARSILYQYEQSGCQVPAVLRLQGINADEAQRVIAEADHPHITLVNTLQEVVIGAVNTVRAQVYGRIR